jgi:hypothetical protein
MPLLGNPRLGVVNAAPAFALYTGYLCVWGNPQSGAVNAAPAFALYMGQYILGNHRGDLARLNTFLFNVLVL